MESKGKSSCDLQINLIHKKTFGLSPRYFPTFHTLIAGRKHWSTHPGKTLILSKLLHCIEAVRLSNGVD